MSSNLQRRIWVTFIAIFASSAIAGCGNRASSDVEELGQQIGDLMAGVDESSGSNGGAYASMSNAAQGRAFARLEAQYDRPLLARWAPSFSLLSEAMASSCGVANTFGSCSANTIVRTFGGCSIGSAVLDGTVTLTWGGGASSCQMTASGHSVARNPDFTLTGRRGATLSVVKTGTHGQVITREASAGAYQFTNDGIRRTFTLASGTKLLDFSTETTAPISITGASRNGRVASGGSLRVTNHRTGVTCDVAPNAVTWSSSCNCAASGTWSGSCSDGKAFTLDITGCGSASLTVGEDVQSFNFDRCYAI